MIAGFMVAYKSTKLPLVEEKRLQFPQLQKKKKKTRCSKIWISPPCLTLTNSEIAATIKSKKEYPFPAAMNYIKLPQHFRFGAR